MGLDYPDLDDETRLHMIAELQADIDSDSTYSSTRFTAQGKHVYRDHLRDAFTRGTDDDLALSLRRASAFASHEQSHRNGKPYTKAVPHDAHITYAEGEFNRYYIRAVCLRAIADGGEVEVVRAKTVASPRSESTAMIGKRLSPKTLLESLRTDSRVDHALGLPPGPNSGLSVRRVAGVRA